MKRALLLATALTVLLGLAPARQAQAGVSVGLSFGTGRHGGFSLDFSSRPNVVLIPSSRVYYVSDFDQDLYCYGDEWYYVNDGAWYMAPSYNGPFAQVAFTSVPYEIRSVPTRYRRHWSGTSAPVYQRYQQPYRAPAYSTPYRNRTWSNVVNRAWDQNQNRDDRNWRDRQDNDRQDRDGRGSDRQNRGNGRGWGRGNNGRGHGR